MRVLAVCTGNICRSPAVELVLAGLDLPGVSAESAGTHAVVSHGVHGPMRDLLLADGLDPSAFQARQLTGRQIIGADLVLAATREHRSAVVREVPRALHRTFTVLELAAIVDEVGEQVLDAGDPVARIAAAARLRATLRRGAEDDVDDPYGHPEEHYRVAYEEITAAVRGGVARLLTPA